MAVDLGELRARLRVDTSDLPRAEGQARASTGRLGEAFSGLGKKVAGLIVAQKVVQFVHGAIDAASDLNETTSKVGVVFGKAKDQVLAFGDGSAKAMGLSRNAALAAAADYGNLFVALKLPTDQSAKMSTRLVQLAGDLASFNNVDPTVALDALKSGLVGETEPLRKFGVNMNDATLHTEALRLGLIKNTKEALTPAAKAQAAYALILDQTKTAQGDFARTSSGLANQQRILSAEWTDAKAKIGAGLMPVMLSLVHLLGGPGISAVEGLGGAVVGLVGVMSTLVRIGAAVAGFLSEHRGLAVALAAVYVARLVPGIAAVVQMWARLQAMRIADTFTGAAAGARNLDSSLRGIGITPLTIGIAAVLAGVVDLVQGLRHAGKEAKDARPQVDNIGKGVSQLDTAGITRVRNELQTLADTSTRAAKDASGKAWLDAGGSISTWGDAVKEARVKLQELDAAQANANRTAATLGARFGLDRAEVGKLAQAAGVDLAGGYDQAVDKVTAYYYATVKASPTTQALAAAQGVLADKTASAKDKVDALQRALDAMSGAALSATDADIAWQQAIDDASAAATKNKHTLDTNSQAGRDNAKALRDLASTTLDNVSAQAQHGASLERVQGIMARARADFVATAIKMGATRTAANLLADQYGLIPSKVTTTVQAFGLTSAATAAQELKRKLDALPRTKDIWIQIRTAGGGKQTFGHIPLDLPGRAEGGRATPEDGPYMVGERRAEVFWPDRPGTVLPDMRGLVAAANGAAMAHLARLQPAAPSQVVHVHAAPSWTADELARALAWQGKAGG